MRAGNAFWSATVAVPACARTRARLPPSRTSPRAQAQLRAAPRRGHGRDDMAQNRRDRRAVLRGGRCSAGLHRYSLALLGGLSYKSCCAFVALLDHRLVGFDCSIELAAAAPSRQSAAPLAAVGVAKNSKRCAVCSGTPRRLAQRPPSTRVPPAAPSARCKIPSSAGRTGWSMQYLVSTRMVHALLGEYPF